MSWIGKATTIATSMVIGTATTAVVSWSGRLDGIDLSLRVLLIVGAVSGVLVGVVALVGMSADGAGRDGFASAAQLRRHLSSNAVRKSGAVTRGRLAGQKGNTVAQFGILLGTAAGRRRLYAAMRDVVLVIAPPQTGKTAWLGGRVIDAPGAVVATSTKTDLYEHTVGLRSLGERSVWVFNPEGLGGVPNSLRWSPLEGCRSPMTAQERSGYLISGASVGGGTMDASFWEQSTVRVLRSLLFAAAASERSMRDVARWVNDPSDRTPLRVLENDPSTPDGWVWDLRQIMDTSADRTKESVYLTLSMALQFMTDPAAAQAVCPEPGDRVFGMRRFLMEGATLYLIGSDREHSSMAPLFAALTGYVFEEAKREAQQRPGGRLDPPLTMALDEAALICPVPLDRWTSDSGGRGIPLLIAVQSPSQLYDRWGERGGQTITNNANALVVFGGLSVAKDLDDLSRLCGEREEKVRTYSAGTKGDRSRSITTRKVPVMAPHEVRQMQQGQALLLYRSLPPVVIKTEAVWDRRDVRRYRKGQEGSLPAWVLDRLPSPAAVVVDTVRRIVTPAFAPRPPVLTPDTALADVGTEAETSGAGDIVHMPERSEDELAGVPAVGE